MKPAILSIDDSKTIRTIISRAFRSLHCDVFEAADGLEGLAMAAKHKPDLILLDLTMPVMDGVDMLGRLRADNELKKIPVIMLTAEAGRETVLKIAKLGVRDYVVKPFKEAYLVERVGRVIELNQADEPAAPARRFDDPINVLVVDNKPAIIEQIQSGLADTSWRVQGRAQTGEALDLCGSAAVDLVVVSLSLPDNAAFSLFQVLRDHPKFRRIPVIGMSVKTAAEEQARAQQAGLKNVITKPIDFDGLKQRVIKLLDLDVTYRYFEERDGTFVVKLPPSPKAADVNTVSTHLQSRLTAAVDAGLERMVLDLRQLGPRDLSSGDVGLVHLGIETARLCQELSLKFRFLCSEPVAKHLENFEEIRASWLDRSANELEAGAPNPALSAAA